MSDDDRMIAATKSVHQSVVYDSLIERGFAAALDATEAVKVYAKLPAWFRVPTPLGHYNPDWAVLVTQDGGDRLYFVVETKGSLLPDDLRAAEAANIECGMVHFRAIERTPNEPELRQARTVDDLLSAGTM